MNRRNKKIELPIKNKSVVIQNSSAQSSFNLKFDLKKTSTSIAWGNHVSPLFKQKVIDICTELKASPGHLMACMAFETGESFSPSIKNKDSGAVGLIQFMPETAESLGTTSLALAAMAAENQLEYVKKYLLAWKGKYSTLSDLYMSILLPKAIGESETYVLFKQGTKAYEQNKGLDLDGDGKITKFEATTLVQKKLDKGLNAENVG